MPNNKPRLVCLLVGITQNPKWKLLTKVDVLLSVLLLLISIKNIYLIELSAFGHEPFPGGGVRRELPGCQLVLFIFRLCIYVLNTHQEATYVVHNHVRRIFTLFKEQVGMGMGMAISGGPMRVCLHPPQASHDTPVITGRGGGALFNS